jgi:hypothetical protein
VAVLQRRFLDPLISIGQVVATARDQAHAPAVALQPEPVAVVLDLVEPVGAAWDSARSGGMQNSNMPQARKRPVKRGTFRLLADSGPAVLLHKLQASWGKPASARGL